MPISAVTATREIATPWIAVPMGLMLALDKIFVMVPWYETKLVGVACNSIMSVRRLLRRFGAEDSGESTGRSCLRGGAQLIDRARGCKLAGFHAKKVGFRQLAIGIGLHQPGVGLHPQNGGCSGRR